MQVQLEGSELSTATEASAQLPKPQLVPAPQLLEEEGKLRFIGTTTPERAPHAVLRLAAACVAATLPLPLLPAGVHSSCACTRCGCSLTAGCCAAPHPAA